MKVNHLILFLCFSFNLSAQTTSHPFWTPASDVYDLEMDTTSNLLYVGGNFTKFTPPQNQMVHWSVCKQACLIMSLPIRTPMSCVLFRMETAGFSLAVISRKLETALESL